jgi:hypothetical protein
MFANYPFVSCAYKNARVVCELQHKAHEVDRAPGGLLLDVIHHVWSDGSSIIGSAKYSGNSKRRVDSEHERHR